MGRPFEVLPFLSGKLLSRIPKSNGSYGDARMQVKRVLKELEALYKQISLSGIVDEKQIEEVLAYKQKFAELLVFGEDL